MSEDEIELHSDSKDKPDKGIVFSDPPSQTFMSRNVKIEWSSLPNMRQDKLSAENRVVPDSARANESGWDSCNRHQVNWSFRILKKFILEMRIEKGGMF